MFSLIKKLISFLLVLIVVALVLNLNIAGRPARQHAENIWNTPTVQRVYQEIKRRVMAVVRKDISVEEVFKADLPSSNKAPQVEKTTEIPPSKSSEIDKTKVIHLEKLDAKDREELDKILEKAASDS